MSWDKHGLQIVRTAQVLRPAFAALALAYVDVFILRVSGGAAGTNESGVRVARLTTTLF